MNTRRRKHGRMIAGLGVMIALLVSLGWLTSRMMQRTNLLFQARRVADVSFSRWNTDWGCDYWWLSPHEVVLWREDDEKHQPLRFIHKNLETGLEEPLTALTQQFHASQGMSGQLYPSPDGTWLLWEGDLTPNKPQSYWGARIDGTQPIHWISKFMENHWLGDRQSWVELVPDRNGAHFTKVLVRTVQAPSIPHVYPISSECPLESVIADRGKMLTGNHMLIETTWNDEIHSPNTVDINELDLNTGGKICRRFSISLPENVSKEQIEYSPQGDRIAWKMIVQRTAPLDVWMHRLMPSWKVKEQYVLGLWVSQLDGTKLREIGHIPTPFTTDDSQNVDFNDIRWLPDGHHLSFIYKDALYVTTVD